MTRPNTPSIILFVTSLVVLAVAWRVGEKRGTTVDRSFLADLCQIPEDEREREHKLVTLRQVAENNEASLLYLWQIGDPEAVRAVVRVTLAELHVPICCCHDGHQYAAFYRDGVGDEFWSVLSELTPLNQARVLNTIDDYGTTLPSGYDVEFDPQADYLAAHSDTRAFYDKFRAERAVKQLAAAQSEELTEASSDR